MRATTARRRGKRPPATTATAAALGEIDTVLIFAARILSRRIAAALRRDPAGTVRRLSAALEESS